LQSRYYDPEVKRFINADGLVSTGQGVLGYNMYAYCLNNPVNRIDPDGMCSYHSFGGYSGKSDCGKSTCSSSKNYLRYGSAPNNNSPTPTPAPVAAPTSNYNSGAYNAHGYGCTCATYHKNGHAGQDIGAAGGPTILAAMDGYISFAGYNPSIPAYGYYIDIISWDSSGGEMLTRYAHLESINSNIFVGASVRSGSPIGVMGGTGAGLEKKYETHLHFEVRINGVAKNPLNYINK